MEWTKEDKKYLLEFRKDLDSDDIKLKDEVKQRLLSNKYIMHVLNNKHLEDEDATPNDYYGINILPYFLIPDTQTEVNNYICYETMWQNFYANKVDKLQQIVFYILCEAKTCMDKETSLPRHDLLAALIEREFNFTELSCGRLQIESSKPSVTDNNFATRTIVFQCKTDKNLVKTINGVPTIINKKMYNG